MAIPGLPTVEEKVNSAVDIVVASSAVVPPVSPVVTLAKSTIRLRVALTAWHYYTDTGCAVMNKNMYYNNVLKDFHIQW